MAEAGSVLRESSKKKKNHRTEEKNHKENLQDSSKNLFDQPRRQADSKQIVAINQASLHYRLIKNI